MWPFWSRDPTKDFPYEVGSVDNSFHEYTFWYFHSGKKKSTGEPVSILRYNRNASSENLDKAKSFLKRIKTLRHPAIITYIDSLEADDLILIVIEACDPLPFYLSTIRNEPEAKRLNAICYGLHQVVIGLKFLHDCNLIHNNIFLGSILVNKNGIWRIGGFEYVISSYTDSCSDKYLPEHRKFIAPELLNKPIKSDLKIWSVDSYGLGCLIWEIFNGNLPKNEALSRLGKIPSDLHSAYYELIETDPNKRISLTHFIDKKRNKFFRNHFLDAMVFLDQIQIKEESEKNRFYSTLTDHLDTFPLDLCKFKILPELISLSEFNNSGAALLGPILKIGKLLREEEFQEKVVPCLIKLFACKDRATRGKLLQEMELFINYLQPSVVNEIFPQIVQGFLDSNSTIREQTVKCMLYLAPKLNYNNLNEEVLRHFARLQIRDEDCGVRSNTTVCLGRIACHLHPQTRQNMLIQAFLRSLRDPFHHARIAGILSLSATQNFYSLRDTATKVMPALCHMTMDQEKTVRDQAFKALKKFIDKVEKVSEDPSLIEKMEGDINAPGSSVSSTFASSWASWAVSALTSKFYRSKSTSNPSSVSGANLNSVKNVTQAKKNDVSSSKNSDSDGVLDGKDIWINLTDNTNSESEIDNISNVKSLDRWDNDGWENTSLETAASEVTLDKNVETFEKITKNKIDSSKKIRNQKETTKQISNKPNTSFSNLDKFIDQQDERNQIHNQPEEMSKIKELKKIKEIKIVQETKEMKKRPKKGPMKLGAQKIT